MLQLKEHKEIISITSKTLSVSKILYPSMNSNFDGISADLFFYGCNRHCKGCHNYSIQEFKQPNKSIYDIMMTLEEHNVKILTLMGGEPLDQDLDTLLVMMEFLKFKIPGLKISLFTGYEFLEVPMEILRELDYLKTGFYDETQKYEKQEFLATKNQKMYKKINGEFIKIFPN